MHLTVITDDPDTTETIEVCRVVDGEKVPDDAVFIGSGRGIFGQEYFFLRSETVS